MTLSMPSDTADRNAVGPSVGQRLVKTIVWVAVVLTLVLGMPLAFEGPFLSRPVGQTAATVVVIEGTHAQDGPPAFRHLVEFPDGSRHPFVCERMLVPGTKIVVNVSRGPLTGRVWLGPPWRVIDTGSGGSDESHP